MNTNINTKQNTLRLLGTGLAVIAVGIAASSRPAAAQSPRLSRPAQVQQIFGGWTHTDRDSSRNRDDDRTHDHDRNGDRRAEQARRDAERARHEAEVRHAEWLREHRNDRDRNRDRDNAHGDWRRDNR